MLGLRYVHDLTMYVHSTSLLCGASIHTCLSLVLKGFHSYVQKIGTKEEILQTHKQTNRHSTFQYCTICKQSYCFKVILPTSVTKYQHNMLYLLLCTIFINILCSNPGLIYCSVYVHMYNN